MVDLETIEGPIYCEECFSQKVGGVGFRTYTTEPPYFDMAFELCLDCLKAFIPAAPTSRRPRRDS